jgi:hypothetical protein
VQPTHHDPRGYHLLDIDALGVLVHFKVVLVECHQVVEDCL